MVGQIWAELCRLLSLASPARAPPPPPCAKVCAWALSVKVTAANGQDIVTPKGDACHDCYEGWEAVYKPQFASWESWVAAKHSTQETSAAFDKALAVWSAKQPADFPQEQVTQDTTASIHVERHFICVSEPELRQLLHTPRLLKSQTKDLRTIQVPDEGDPSKQEVMYVFADPLRPFRSAVLRTGMQLSTSAMIQDRASSAYAGQGQFLQRKSWEEASVNATSLVGAALPSLGSFMASLGVRAPGGPQVTGSASHASASAGALVDKDGDDDDAFGDDSSAKGDDEDELKSVPQVVGIAAASTAVPRLATPIKGRSMPPVPAFSAGVPESAPQRSARMGQRPVPMDVSSIAEPIDAGSAGEGDGEESRASGSIEDDGNLDDSDGLNATP